MKLAAVSRGAIAVCLISSLVFPAIAVLAEPGRVTQSSDPTPLNDAMSFRDLDAETNAALRDAYRNHDNAAAQRIKFEYRRRLSELHQRQRDTFRTRQTAADKHNQDVAQAMQILSKRFPDQPGKVGVAIREIAARDDVVAAAEAYGVDQSVHTTVSPMTASTVIPQTDAQISEKTMNDSEQRLRDAMSWSKKSKVPQPVKPKALDPSDPDAPSDMLAPEGSGRILTNHEKAMWLDYQAKKAREDREFADARARVAKRDAEGYETPEATERSVNAIKLHNEAKSDPTRGPDGKFMRSLDGSGLAQADIAAMKDDDRDAFLKEKGTSREPGISSGEKDRRQAIEAADANIAVLHLEEDKKFKTEFEARRDEISASIAERAKGKPSPWPEATGEATNGGSTVNPMLAIIGGIFAFGLAEQAREDEEYRNATPARRAEIDGQRDTQHRRALQDHENCVADHQYVWNEGFTTPEATCTGVGSRF